MVRVVLTAEEHPEGESFAGALTLVDLAGNEAVRSLSGETCLELANALALVVALDAVDDDREGSRASDDARAPAPMSRSAAPAPSERARWESSVLASVGARTSVSDRIGPSFGAAFSLSRENAGSRWAPSFRAGLEYAVSRGGDARYLPNGSSPVSDRLVRLATAKLDACSLRIESGRVTALPCLRLEAGAHYGAVLRGGSSSAPWLAGGPLGRFHVRVVSALFAEVDVGMLFPVTRTRFYSEAMDRAETVPAIIPFGTLAAGLTFP